MNKVLSRTCSHSVTYSCSPLGPAKSVKQHSRAVVCFHINNNIIPKCIHVVELTANIVLYPYSGYSEEIKDRPVFVPYKKQNKTQNKTKT